MSKVRKGKGNLKGLRFKKGRELPIGWVVYTPTLRLLLGAQHFLDKLVSGVAAYNDPSSVR